MKLKTQHLKRYKELTRLFLKYGRSDAVPQSDLVEGLSAGSPKDIAPEPTPDTASPEELADDLERMGPTYVKLGQILSSRPDLLPPAYIKALTRLQDKVKPFPYEDVERIIHEELGVRISKAFAEFDQQPVAAASLGQVHRARLRDGRRVVVKVQRPDIREQIAQDMEVLEEIAQFLENHTAAARQFQFANVLDEVKRTLRQELDYEREAANMKTVAVSLAEFPNIIVPLPVDALSTRSVLTMDYVDGTKITELNPVVRLDFKGGALADELFRAYLKQVLVDGVFHADPHPGNVFLTPDHRVALLDLGMVGRTSPDMQERLLRLLVAVSEGQSDSAATLVIEASRTRDDFDEQAFRRDIATLVTEQLSTPLARLDVGSTLLGLARNAAANGLFVPTELTLLGKTLLQLDEIGRYLDPQFDPNAAIRRHATEILNQRVRKDFTPGNLFSSLLELKHFAGHLPGRLNRILDAVANAELELNVRSTDISQFIEGMQKIANRITTGLILAALIIGASLLMNVETNFRILGYPGFAMLLFLAAAGIGFWLVITILTSDQRSKREIARK